MIPKIKLKSIVFLLGLAMLGRLADSHHYCFCLEAEEMPKRCMPKRCMPSNRELSKRCVSTPWKNKSVRKSLGPQ